MSKRTVLAIDLLDREKFIIRAVRAPFNIAGAQNPQSLPLLPADLPSLDTAAAVRARGTCIRDAMRQHAGVSKLLDRLGEAAQGELAPLFVMLPPSEAESICWEVLCDGNGRFVALDRRWPITRIIDPLSGSERPRSVLQLPVRLMAVVSAIGIDSQRKEWEQLRKAIVDARAGGLEVAAKVLVGEHGLRAAIDQEIAAGLAGVEVGAIEETSERLTQAIRQWKPNLLHFFCHGHADVNGQRLELATANDYLQHAAGALPGGTGSVGVTIEELEALGAELGDAWLMVLNCCSSGQAERGLQSMAARIVSAGVPAVVAMMEPVDAHDAYEFTRAFYPAVFDVLKAASDELKQKQDVVVEWAPAMYYARRAISQLDGRDAESSHEWSLPVLYVRGIDARGFTRADGASPAQLQEYRVQADVTAKWLRTAGQQLDEAQRRDILERVMAGVPRNLWPTADGRFDRADDP